MSPAIAACRTLHSSRPAFPALHQYDQSCHAQALSHQRGRPIINVNPRVWPSWASWTSDALHTGMVPAAKRSLLNGGVVEAPLGEQSEAIQTFSYANEIAAMLEDHARQHENG